MAIYVMADLHLSTNQHTNKSMEVFGNRWKGYTEKIRKNWEAVVSPEDTVVVPGDVSWGMNLEEALSDFQFIDRLPGQKLIGKGNHDFWWTTSKKMTDFFAAHQLHSLHILYNNAYCLSDRILCGTRGWFLDEKQQVTVGDVNYDKMIHREAMRLRMSLEKAKAMQDSEKERTGRTWPITVFLHFPPVWMDFVCRPIVDLLHEYEDPDCYFGHIHGTDGSHGRFSFEGISLKLIASDALNFTLYRLPDANQTEKSGD